jgi:hypothetical protein
MTKLIVTLRNFAIAPKMMGESGNWTPNSCVIKRLEVIWSVLPKLQSVSFGSFQTFRSALNVCQHRCDKLKSPMTCRTNLYLSSFSPVVETGSSLQCSQKPNGGPYSLLDEIRTTQFQCPLFLCLRISLSSLSLSLSLSLSNDISSGLLSTILYALLLSSVHSVSPVHFLVQRSLWQYLLKRICYEDPYYREHG